MQPESSTGLVSVPAAVTVIARPHPFSIERVYTEFDQGLSVAQMLGWDAVNCRVEIGGILIPREHWGRIRPHAGIVVTVTRFPAGGGGGGFKMIFRLVAFAALAVLTYGIATPGAIQGLLPGFIQGLSQGAAAAVAAAVGIGGSLLINALIPPAATGVGNQTTPTSLQGINGVQNSVDPYGAVTCVFGTMLVYPKLASRSYTFLSGDSQFVKALFDLGYGVLAVAQPQLGTDTLDNFTGVTYQIGPSPTLFPQDVLEISAGNEMDTDSMSATHSTGENADEGAIDLIFGNGLFAADTSGGNLTATCKIKIEFAADDVITAGAIVAIPVLDPGAYSGAPISATVDISGDGTGAAAIVYTGIIGSDGTDWLYGITQIVMINNGGGYTTATATLNVSFDNQITAAQVDTPQIGTLAGGSWQNVMSQAGLTISNSSATSDGTYLVCASSERKTFRVGVQWKFPQRGFYNVRVTRYSTDWSGATANNRSGNLTWTVIRTVRYTLPSTTPTTKLAMQIKATDQLNGTVSNFNLIVAQLIPVWNGTAWVTQRSSNPAWIFRWLLTQCPANPRKVDVSRIDDPTLTDWAADCTAKGFSFNYVNDQITTVFELIKIVCAAGRASFTVVDGKYSVVRDLYQTVPIQVFTPRNTSGFQGSRAFVDVVHGMRVQFINPQAGYQQDELLVYDDGYDEQNASKFEQLQIPGCVDMLMAWKLGRYHLAVARLRPNSYSWNTDVEHLICNRGDLVLFASDVISEGLGWGRVKSITMDGSGNITKVTVDEPQTVPDIDAHDGHLGDLKIYGMRFRCQDKTVKSSIVTFTPDTMVAEFTLAIPQPGINPGDLFLFGLQGQDSIPMLINRIEPTTDLAAKITAVDAAPDVLAADAGYIDSNGVQHLGHPPLVSSITGQVWLEDGTPPTFTDVPSSSGETGVPMLEVSIG